MARITLDHVSREVQGQQILDGVSFDAAEGEFIGLIGASGAGKTSVIRAIAGFDPVTAGSIRFDNDDITETPTAERDIGIVTQGNNLFPTKRVRANLLFPLWARGIGRDEANARVEAESRANALTHILDRWPATLSAGEQQLTQIARALIRRPRVFLMDEPLANLDPPTRRRLREELVSLQKGYGVTAIYVANRSDEIMTMPDRLVAIERGRVIQVATPSQAYREPASLAIARLTGDVGTLRGTVLREGTELVLSGLDMSLRLLPSTAQRHIGEHVTLAVRSEDVRVSGSGSLTFTAGGLSYERSGSVRELLSPAGVIGTADHDLTEGSKVSVWLDRWRLYDSNGHLIS
jgi:ABC-type sugar transport system ATPase subunit